MKESRKIIKEEKIIHVESAVYICKIKGRGRSRSGGGNLNIGGIDRAGHYI
jgi:hypothetical protein